MWDEYVPGKEYKLGHHRRDLDDGVKRQVHVKDVKLYIPGEDELAEFDSSEGQMMLKHMRKNDSIQDRHLVGIPLDEVDSLSISAQPTGPNLGGAPPSPPIPNSPAATPPRTPTYSPQPQSPSTPICDRAQSGQLDRRGATGRQAEIPQLGPLQEIPKWERPADRWGTLSREKRQSLFQDAVDWRAVERYEDNLGQHLRLERRRKDMEDKGYPVPPPLVLRDPLDPTPSYSPANAQKQRADKLESDFLSKVRTGTKGINKTNQALIKEFREELDRCGQREPVPQDKTPQQKEEQKNTRRFLDNLSQFTAQKKKAQSSREIKPVPLSFEEEIPSLQQRGPVKTIQHSLKEKKMPGASAQRSEMTRSPWELEVSGQLTGKIEQKERATSVKGDDRTQRSNVSITSELTEEGRTLTDKDTEDLELMSRRSTKTFRTPPK